MQKMSEVALKPCQTDDDLKQVCEQYNRICEEKVVFEDMQKMVHPQLTLMSFPSNMTDKILGHIGGSIFQNQKTGGLFGIIPYFAVESEFRNQGIGTALLKALIDLYQMNNATCIVVNVDLYNPCIKLFERFGFRCELGKIQRYASGKRAL